MSLPTELCSQGQCTIYFVTLSTNFYMVLLNKNGGMQSHRKNAGFKLQIFT